MNKVHMRRSKSVHIPVSSLIHRSLHIIRSQLRLCAIFCNILILSLSSCYSPAQPTVRSITQSRVSATAYSVSLYTRLRHFLVLHACKTQGFIYLTYEQSSAKTRSIHVLRFPAKCSRFTAFCLIVIFPKSLGTGMSQLRNFIRPFVLPTLSVRLSLAGPAL
jgi:hypothetical protein